MLGLFSQEQSSCIDCLDTHTKWALTSQIKVALPPSFFFSSVSSRCVIFLLTNDVIPQEAYQLLH